MGIKNLKKFLDEQFNISKSVPIYEFKGKRVAIDISNWMYNNMYISRKMVINKTDDISKIDKRKIAVVWFNKFLKFIIKWLENDIIPVIIFDGMSIPEKRSVIAKRRKIKEDRKNNITELFEKYKTNKLVETELREQLKNDIFIDPLYYDNMKILLDNIGVKYLYARDDAEKLCSSLCIEGYVDFVFSNDTDNFVFGSPVTVMGFGGYIQKNKVKYLTLKTYYLKDIHEKLNLSHKEFVDFAIFLGCDYNDRKTNGCNFNSILKLFHSYGVLENFPSKYLTPDINFKTCRHIFEYEESKSLMVKGYSTVDGETYFNLQPDINYDFKVLSNSVMTAKEIIEKLGI